MCVRAWTHGYDLFMPHRTVLWHEYSRRGRVCHWDDHSDWGHRHGRAIDQYRRQFGLDGTPRQTFPPYDFGTARSFREYERFAGIEFASRGVHPHTIANGVPPDPDQRLPDDEWRRSLVTSHCADVFVHRAALAHDDCHMWSVFANAEDGTELFREDYLRDRVDHFLTTQSGEMIHFCIAFFDRRRPYTWTVWPYSQKRGWLERVCEPWPHPAPSPPLAVAESCPGG